MQADQQIFPLRSREVRAAVNRTAVGQGKQLVASRRRRS